MKVVSTNIAKPKTVQWRGKNVTTGIFKEPVSDGIFLQRETVQNDTVSDRKVHGGEFKACYLFSLEEYPFWKDKYPDLTWQWGMFGENLTVSGLNEKKLIIGDIYKVGSATVQITEPRQPCFKLGIRFGTQSVLKEFIEHGCSGSYVRVLKNGNVRIGDELVLIQDSDSTLTIFEYNQLVNGLSKDKFIIKQAISTESIRKEKREKLKKLL